MILKTRNGFIYNEDGAIVGSLGEDSNEEVEVTIAAGSEALEAINQFIADVNSGSLKQRKAFNTFKQILDKYDLKYV